MSREFVKSSKKLKGLVLALSIVSVVNLVLPYVFAVQVYAQETPAVQASATPELTVIATPDTNPTVVPTPVSTPTESPSEAAVPSENPSPIPTASEVPAPTATPLPSLIPSSTVVPSAPAPSVWKDLGLSRLGGVSPVFETINNVEISKDYTAPQNDKVKINFTKLTETVGKLTIKEIKLSQGQVEQLEAVSDTAYDITSTMADGTFAYDLTLPLPEQAKGKKIEIKSAENTDELLTAEKVNETKEEKVDTITIKDLNHFTVFVITTPDPDTTQKVLINEVVPNPLNGAEWVELFNNSTQATNLGVGSGWTIRNSLGDTQSLSSLGTIPAAGRVVFEAPANWLSNTAPETITLSNELGTVVDSVTISLTSQGFAIDHYPLANESVGRKTDGVAQWTIFTAPTKGTANVLPKADTGLSETGPVNPNTGFPSWYKDSRGLAIDLMEAADGFGISDPVDPSNPFSEQIGFNAEGFWWSAEASIDRPIGTRTILVLAVEAAFAGEAAVDGEQSVQNRLRYRIDGLVPGETYTITHPFGDVKEVAEDDGTINVTDDIGCFAGGGVTCNQTAVPNFATALNGSVGPFLTWDTFNTNPALTDPQLINPANLGRRYVGNPSIEHIVTGSPTGNNFFRVQGKDVGGPGVNQIETSLFAVSGRLADANAPVITLFGTSPVNVNQNAVYTDAGATAIDDLGGNLTGSLEVSGLPVDTSTPGAKTVTYTVTDSAGRTSQATRTVNVVETPVLDTTAPVITVLGDNLAFVTVGTPYTDSGATALDNVDGNISGSIATTGLPVNTSAVGTFTVTYNVSDAAGNAATPAIRIIKVVADTTAPVITILGSNPVNIFTGALYADSGATALDDVDGDITGSIVTTGLPVDTSIAATFTITYEVVDQAGNPAIAKRIVKVAESLPAGLSETGPVNPNTGFPSWYKDSNGLALDLMEASDGFSISDPVDPANPFSQQIGFNAEAFWWSAEAAVNQDGINALVVNAMEAAFAGEFAVDGEQSAFGRVRFRIDVPTPGTYTVKHPFGTETFVVDAVGPGPEIRNAGIGGGEPDFGCFVCNPNNFSLALQSQIGPFLTWDTFSSDPALTDPQLTNSGNPNRRYVGNPLVDHAIKGSPVGQNFFEITGPGGIKAFTELFTVSGRLADFQSPIITLSGDNPVVVIQGGVYQDAGATALDDFDGNLTASIQVTGLPVDTSILGAKTITYTVSDRAGNTAIAQRTVNVVGSNPPADTTNLGGTVVDIRLGQADVDSLLELDSGAALDLAGNLSVATTDGVITIAGLPKLLSIFSNGDLVNQNLTLPQIIGDKLVMVSKAVRLNSGPSGSLITLFNKNLSTVKLSIVSGTTVLGESSWNGKVNPPSTVTNTGTAPSGFKLGNFAIEVGYPEGILLFDQPVTILLSGVNGPVGYKPSGSDTWVKMANCLGTFDSPLKPVFPGECAISNGVDTKIYTYHLTSFANLQEIPPASTPTPTPAIVVANSSNTATNTNTTSSNSNLSNSSSNNTSNNPSAPVCSDSKPGSAPILLSAVTSGPNQVTLTWSKASDPVSHYSIVYGLLAGNPIYGNTNVGGKGTTSYVVGGLSGGTTYYFKVRASNGCNGSEYSNELSAAPDGGTINSPAIGFTRGLLGAQTEEETKTNESGVLGANVNGLASKSKGTWAIQLMLAALAALGVVYFKFFYKKRLNG